MVVIIFSITSLYSYARPLISAYSPARPSPVQSLGGRPSYHKSAPVRSSQTVLQELTAGPHPPAEPQALLTLGHTLRRTSTAPSRTSDSKHPGHRSSNSDDPALDSGRLPAPRGKRDTPAERLVRRAQQKAIHQEQVNKLVTKLQGNRRTADRWTTEHTLLHQQRERMLLEYAAIKSGITGAGVYKADEREKMKLYRETHQKLSKMAEATGFGVQGELDAYAAGWKKLEMHARAISRIDEESLTDP